MVRRSELAGYNYYNFSVNSQFADDDPTLTTYFDDETLRAEAELVLTF